MDKTMSQYVDNFALKSREQVIRFHTRELSKMLSVENYDFIVNFINQSSIYDRLHLDTTNPVLYAKAIYRYMLFILLNEYDLATPLYSKSYDDVFNEKVLGEWFDVIDDMTMFAQNTVDMLKKIEKGE